MLGSLCGVFTSCTRSQAHNDDKLLLNTPSEAEAHTEVPKPEEQSTKPTARTRKCIFCDISREKGFDIVWENEDFIAFNDYRPVAAHHLLVIPRKHIASVKVLKQEDADMVKEMAAIGNNLLDELNVPKTSRRLGFHIPPFNSVMHLHLHVQGLPYKNALRDFNYLVAAGKNGRTKGFSWFAEVEQTISILEKGGRVGVFSC